MTLTKARGARGGSFSRPENQILGDFRHRLAGFLRRRKDAARSEGLQPQQYELLLSITGLEKGKEPTIKELAHQLCLEHHTVVELADRLAKKGLLARHSSGADKRIVL